MLAFSQHNIYTTYTLQPISTDTEVCISYGCLNKTNAELMKDYGFVIAGNINDRIDFSAGTCVAELIDYSVEQYLVALCFL